MAKQLVGRDNVEQFICHEEKKLYVGKTLILTPGAKDYLQEKSISVVYGEAPEAAEKSTPKSAVSSANDLHSTIQQLLKNDFSITDSALVTEVTGKVMERLEQLK
jgi:ethanolamine utilization cobalamin adenosyltransferase